MARVIAFARPIEIARVAIVCGCALALIAAGNVLPFIR